jgi:hypothetical protein
MESQPCLAGVSFLFMQRRPAGARADTCTHALCGLRKSIGGGPFIQSPASLAVLIACEIHHRPVAIGHDAWTCGTCRVQAGQKKSPGNLFSGFRGHLSAARLLIRYVPGKPSIGIMPVLNVATCAMEMAMPRRLSAWRLIRLLRHHVMVLGLLGFQRQHASECCALQRSFRSVQLWRKKSNIKNRENPCEIGRFCR